MLRRIDRPCSYAAVPVLITLALCAALGACRGYVMMPETQPPTTTRNYYLGVDLPLLPDSIDTTEWFTLPALDHIVVSPEGTTQVQAPRASTSAAAAVQQTQPQPKPRLSAGIGIPAHSIAEVNAFLQAHTSVKQVGYSVTPKESYPYVLGRIDDTTRTSILNFYNCMRFIAGVPANITWDEENSDKAQAAALLLARNQTVSHAPERPADMPEALFQLGYDGAGSSNIGGQISGDSLNATLFLFLGDTDERNISRLAHRRWMLRPSIGKTAFGSVNGYSAMTVFDTSNTQANSSHEIVMYPAQVTPSAFFRDSWAWSAAFAKGFDVSNAKVTMVRRNDGIGWQFGYGQNSGEFYIDTKEVGGQSCVIFLPWQVSCHPGEVYDVQIDGVTKNGKPHLVQYTVQFM